MAPHRTKDLAAIVLAAGDGTRMLSRIPKVIHSLYGKPLISHVLDAVRGAGIRRIIVVVGYRSDLVRDHLGPGVETVVQRTLKGTADAVRQALPKLAGFRGDIVIFYGDTPLLTSQTVRGLINAHRRAKASCSLLTAHLKEPVGYGRIVRDQTGNIVRIVEDTDATQVEQSIDEINVGAYCFGAASLRKALNHVTVAKNGEYYLTDTVAYLVKQGAPVTSASTHSVGEFLGINTRADLARVQTIMRSRILERFMLEGVTIIDPYTTYIDGSAVIGQDTVIYPHTVIEKGVRIGKGCQVGPFCRVGTGTLLEDNVFVGSFVELTDARVGKGSRVLRHSFIDHAVIGRKVYVGVGTITVLSNGAHPTASSKKVHIGNRAFVEGGSFFLGPVRVKSGDRIPAGSVLGRQPRKGTA